MDTPPQQDPRVYLAAERTFLAWIRTGLGLMGVGFAVSRFGLFLREFSAAQAHPQQGPTAHSVAAGVVLVALGVLVTLVATLQHFALTRQLASGQWQPGRVSRIAVSLAILLAILGAAMAFYLIRIH